METGDRFIMSKNFLVIGGSGFIGSHICDYLDGKVIIYDIYCHPNTPYECHNSRLDELISNADIVYNFAGILGTSSSFEYIQKTIDVNISFAVNLMEKCLAKGKTLISVGLPSESMWLNPYSITKGCMRRFAQMFYEGGLKGCTVIPYNVYGERQAYSKTQKLIPTVIHSILEGEPIPVYNKGQQNIDLIYVKDVARFVVGLKDFSGREIHVGSGMPIKVIDVVDKICAIMGVMPNIDWIPRRRGEGESVNVVSPNAIDGIDFVDCIDLAEGLRKTISWYESFYDFNKVSDTKSDTIGPWAW
jgi:UDP-glucose 4-epimerase